MTRRYADFLALLILVGACAEDVPGTEPTAELFYPTSMVFVPGNVASEDRLVVSNSNFDQRFNASTLIALSVDELFRLTAGLSLNAPSTEMPVESVVRIPSLSGQLSYVASSSTSASDRIFVTSRGQNRLTMVRLENGSLDCGNDGRDPLPGLDCTEAHVVDSGGSDPYALSYVPSSRGSGYIATGHLRATDRSREEIRPDVGIVTFADIDVFKQRVADERAGKVLSNPILDIRVPSLTGVSGVMMLAHDSSTAKSELAVVDMNQTAGAVSVWEIDERASEIAVRSTSKLVLGALTNSFSTRGLVTTASADRAYVSVRFSESGSAFNAGIAVLARKSGAYVLNSIYELGSELGLPSLRETRDGRRLLYVGDVRTDRVWILDVTSDAPRVVGELTGRAEGLLEGESARFRIFDAPSSIVFLERGVQTLGFVANFSNSTLAVIDASDVDPRKHKVVGRLGRVIEPDGTTEEDNE